MSVVIDNAASENANSTPDRGGRSEDPVLLVVLGLLLACLVCAAYNALLQQRFVLWDDGEYLVSNRHLKGGLNWDNVVWSFTGTHQANYHPVTWLSFLADVTFYGMDPYPVNVKPWAFKATNLAFHCANTVLVYALFYWMTKRLWPSLLVGAFFGLHPLHVESVAWATERKDVLSTFFFLLSIAAYLRYAQRNRFLPYLAMLVAYVLSLFSKQMYVTLPAVLILLDYWPLRRLGWQSAPAEQRNPAFAPVSLTRAIAEKLPLLALAIGSAGLIFAIQVLDPVVGNVQPPLLIKIQNVVYSYGVYLRKLVWPMDLSFFYPFPREPYAWIAVIWSAAVLISVTALAVALRRRAPYLICGWLWYLGMLVPTIGIVQVGWQAYADRYTYAPLIGVIFAIIYGLDDIARRFKKLDLAIKGLEIAAIVGCTYVAMVQVGYWRDTSALSLHALELDPDNFVACVQLGTIGAEDYQWAPAVNWLRKSRDLRPEYLTTRLNLAIVELVLGNVDESRREYETALKMNPKNAEGQYQLGMIYLGQNEADKAAECFRNATKYMPGNMRYHFGLGLAQIKRKDHAAARDVLTRVRDSTRTHPKMKDDTIVIMDLLDGIEKGDESAIAKYKRWYDMPATVSGSMQAYSAGLKLGRKALQAFEAGDKATGEKELKRSFEIFEHSLKLWPNNFDTLHNLGVLNFKIGRHAEAMSYFRKALDINPYHEVSKKGLDMLTKDIVGGALDDAGVELDFGDTSMPGQEPPPDSGGDLSIDPTGDPVLFPQ